MKKAFVLLASILAVLALSGCMTSKKASSKSSRVPQVIGAEGIVQPDWVYKTVNSPDLHFETGYGKMSGKQISIKRATVEAKNKIAEWVRTSVKEVIMTYVNDTGNDDIRQSLDVMETISTQVAEATLSGVTTEEMWVDADGGVWVLCSIPLANIEKSFDPASQAISESFFENDAANAANAKMKDAFANLLKGTV